MSKPMCKGPLASGLRRAPMELGIQQEQETEMEVATLVYCAENCAIEGRGNEGKCKEVDQLLGKSRENLLKVKENVDL